MKKSHYLLVLCSRLLTLSVRWAEPISRFHLFLILALCAFRNLSNLSCFLLSEKNFSYSRRAQRKQMPSSGRNLTASSPHRGHTAPPAASKSLVLLFPRSLTFKFWSTGANISDALFILLSYSSPFFTLPIS